MCPRPKKNRKITSPPKAQGFKPIGFRFKNTEVITLNFDEYEAIKFVDYEGLLTSQAAERMHVSRPTFSRVYNSAKKKIAQALVEIKSIVIEGGSVEFAENWYRCLDCNETFSLHEHGQTCPNCISDNSELVE